mgnify:CR=1 FL=1
MEIMARLLFVFFISVVHLNMMAQNPLAITGQVKCQGDGVANVVVTNGFDCVLTDASGKYTIPYHRDARFVYVTTPAGYLPQRDGSLSFILSAYYRRDLYICIFLWSRIQGMMIDILFLVQADVQRREKARMLRLMRST